MKSTGLIPLAELETPMGNPTLVERRLEAGQVGFKLRHAQVQPGS